MSTSPQPWLKRNDYPTSDGRPMAETDDHRDLMNRLIKTLQAWYAEDEKVYVSGNLLVFYVPGDKRRHVAPDVFVVKGVPNVLRPNYLVWEEGKGPDVVLEITSASTKNEDMVQKFALYQNTLRVPEYFLFDPFGDYLDPPLQGYRLTKGQYTPIRQRRGRLPSKILGLHLERDGRDLRLYDPSAGQWLPTPEERLLEAEERAAEAEERAVEAEERAAEVEAENQRLRRALEELRRQLGDKK